MEKKGGEVVCVTGGSGFIGSWLVRLLLDRGYTVHATVKDLNDERETKHLQALEQGTDEQSRLRLFQIDLLEYDSIVAAVNGTTGVLDPDVLRPFLSSTYMYIVFSHFGFGHFGLVEQFWGSLGGNLGSGSMLNSHTLVLDGEKGELVKAPGGVEKKDGVLKVKDVAALKSHSEAERRRREMINAHLDTLRGLVPCAGKLLLASGRC